MKWLVVLFIVVPLLELYLLLTLGSWIGFWPTIAITLITAFVGGALAKREGLKVWRAWRTAIAELRPPEQGVIDGVLVLIGGALLITPGFISDVTGVLLMLPFSRRWVAARIRRAIDRRLADGRIRVEGASFVNAPLWSAAPANGEVDVVETSGEAVVSDAPELPSRERREP